MELVRINDKVLQTPIADLGMTERTGNLLLNEGIYTLLDLLYCCAKTIDCDRCLSFDCIARRKLIDIRYIGSIEIKHILDALEKKGICRRSPG